MTWLTDHQRSACPFETHEPCAEEEIERLRRALLHRCAVRQVDEACAECREIVTLLDVAE